MKNLIRPLILLLAISASTLVLASGFLNSARGIEARSSRPATVREQESCAACVNCPPEQGSHDDCTHNCADACGPNSVSTCGAG